MDNMKEISLEELKNISGGELCRSEKKLIDSYIDFKKNNGGTMEQALSHFDNPEVREYIKTNW